MGQETQVALVGAGYIASWHAEALAATPGVAITAVCDTSEAAAKALAYKYGARVFTSVADMVAAGNVDAAHILTPPHAHAPVAIECLEGGLDVLIEKPLVERASDVTAIQKAADKAGKRAFVGHNFLALPSYERMKAALKQGKYGRISTMDVTWALPLPPLRSGPYGLWMLREPGNIVREIGPHLMAPIVDLFGEPVVRDVSVFKSIEIPGGIEMPQSVRVILQAGHVDITMTISLVESMDDRSIVLRGSSARVRLDMGQDTLEVDADNTSEIILNPLRRQLGLAGQHLREGARNFWAQASSLNNKSPYGLSFRGMTKAVYDSLKTGAAEPRFDLATGLKVMNGIDSVVAGLPNCGKVAKREAPAALTKAPDVLVIGGTGFIGRVLTRTLAERGHTVRVLSRGRYSPFTDIADKVETKAASLYDVDGLTEAMQGIDTVYNLAKYVGSNWQDCVDNEITPVMNVAQAVQNAGVRRLVYTGTIASYDMSDPRGTITENTSFGETEKRNLYARSKAECERMLFESCEKTGLPVTIARPGIVVGEGGPLQHWGIGRWHGAGAVRIWGNGKNILPFVLVDDVVDGLILMSEKDTVGQSYNLIGDPMLSGRDYFGAIKDQLGADIKISSGNLTSLFAIGLLKDGLKRYVLRRKGIDFTSLADWKSRGHLTPFDNSKPKADLGWKPEDSKDRFIEQAITHANLFGF